MQQQVLTANIIFYCRHWEATVQFYRDQLRLPVLFSTDWFVEFGLNAHTRLSIADEQRASIKSCGGRGVTLTLEVEDLKRVHEYAQRRALQPTSIRRHPWGAEVFYLVDPEGHRVELWQKGNFG